MNVPTINKADQHPQYAGESRLCMINRKCTNHISVISFASFHPDSCFSFSGLCHMAYDFGSF